MALYAISLRLPADLDDDKAASFASAPCDEDAALNAPFAPAPLAGTAARDDRDHRENWTIQWIFAEKPDLNIFSPSLHRLAEHYGIELPQDEASAPKLDILPDKDWLSESYKQFTPFHESGFYIYGSHIDVPEPGTDIPLLVDAATAFGSGEHGTTAGCLEALSYLKQSGFEPDGILDVGTGSGILAIAAWRLWHRPVLATDIDPESVRVTLRHCDFNNLPDSAVQAIVSDGFAAPILQQSTTYDLVIANILAGPLITLCDGIVSRTRSKGYIILSGMLQEQSSNVIAAYCAAQYIVSATFNRGDWTSLLLVKL